VCATCRTLALVKPDAIKHVGRILNCIYQSGFEVLRLKSLRLKRQEVIDFYEDEQAEPYFK